MVIPPGFQDFYWLILSYPHAAHKGKQKKCGLSLDTFPGKWYIDCVPPIYAGVVEW
jgi:hypothetical protein